MAPTRRIGEVLAEKASSGFVGRERELAALTKFVEQQGLLVTWIHGLAGSGKSALLKEFRSRATAAGCTVIRLDCRLIEPTPEGLLTELEGCLRCSIDGPASIPASINEAFSSSSRPVLILDAYEVFRLLDGWIRQVFLPGLDDNIRVIISSRYAPAQAWGTALEWHGLVDVLQLRPLTEAESSALLTRMGVEASEANAIYRMAQGHAMTLVLAAGVNRATAGLRKSGDSPGLVRQLTQMYLADVTDPGLRSAVEAGSAVRRITQSLLAAMLPEVYSSKLYEDLAALPIIEVTAEGLMLHEQVQEAVSSWLRSADPHRFNGYRRVAWQQLRVELAKAGRRDSWRYTADLLYLVENPALREAYFPTGAQALSFENARPTDGPSILAIAAAHESPQAAAAVARCWDSLPGAFYVARETVDQIAGFYIAAEVREFMARTTGPDAARLQLHRHWRENPLAPGETALFLRRWLSKTSGASLSPVQAACWLDVKRFHMGLRPQIRRCYGWVSDAATFAPMLLGLGFRPVSEPILVDGVPHQLLMLDFGPGSFDGWLSALVSNELGMNSGMIVDQETRELLHDGERTALTALEFGVLTYLQQFENKAVSRAALLHHVWGKRSDLGSNVVDVVVRSLRRKLDGRAWMVATVRGVGYRSVRRRLNSAAHERSMGMSKVTGVTAGGDEAQLSPAAIAELRSRLQGSLFTASDGEYDDARALWNAMHDRRPTLIVRCAGQSDVVAAVNFAREHHLPVAVRCGGHNVAGSGSCHGGLQLDMSGLKNVTVDPVQRTARVEPGVTWGEFDRQAQVHGLATTGGICSGTGVAGVTLGGGFGWLVRKHGLSLDNLESLEVVTADGQARTVSATENADLFFGMRGTQSNLGIVTEMKFRLHPVGPTVLAGMVLHPLERGKEVLRFYRDYTSAAPEELAASAALLKSPDGAPMVAILACYTGPLESGERWLEPLRLFGPPLMDMLAPMSYLAAQSLIDASFPKGRFNYWKSSLLGALSDQLIDTLVERYPLSSSPYSSILIEHLGGAMSRVPAGDTAFPHRDAAYGVVIMPMWTSAAESEAHINWADELWRAFAPFESGVYVNYLSNEGGARVQDAYGANFARLQLLKARYDSTNLFCCNQNIR